MKSGALDRPRNRETRRFIRIASMIAAALIVAVSSQQRADAARSNILGSIARDRRDESSRLLPCIVAFVDDHFDHPERLSVWLPDETRDVPDLARPLLSELYARGAVYISNVGLMNSTQMRDISAHAVILSKNATALDGRDICFTNYCEHDCDFAIALTSRFADETSFLATVDALTERLCWRSISVLSILAPVGDSVLLAGKLLDRIDGTYVPVKSVLLGKCEGRARAVRWRCFTDRRKVLHGTRVVSAAMFNSFPYSFPANVTGQLRFDGVVGLMVETIARKTGIELNREMIAWTDNSVEDELYLRLYNSTRNDLVLGGLLWDSDSRFEYTKTYGHVSVAWMVPMERSVSLRGLINPFKAEVWYAIICVLIIGGLARLFFIRDISCLHIAALILGNPVRQPTRTSSRIQFIFWAMFGFFITLSYLASLAYQLIHTSNLQIETLEQLISSELMLGGNAEFADLLGTNDTTDEDDILQTIRKNFIIFEESAYISQKQDLVAGRNNSLALIVMLNLSEIHHTSNVGYGHIVKENIGTYPLAFASWRGFPYLKDINLGILMLRQAGVIQYWTNMVALKANYYEVIKQDDMTKIDTEDLAPVFLLLIIGYLSGCCLFIVEVLSVHRNCYQLANKFVFKRRINNK